MKKTILFVLTLCLCLAVFGGSAFAETAATEAPAAEAPAAEKTAEELLQAGREAYSAEDYGKALEYFQLAADGGHAEAWRSIGYLYNYGLGVEQGEPYAMFGMGECCYEGKGVEKDPDKAAEWYRKALAAGYEPDEADKVHLKDVLGDDYQ